MHGIPRVDGQLISERAQLATDLLFSSTNKSILSLQNDVLLMGIRSLRSVEVL